MKFNKNIFDYLTVKQGDITKEKTGAIVNAANPSLLGGGGVDGAIHKAAGPELLQECRELGGCKNGEARITKAYKLPASYIIHTPGPVYRDGRHGEDEVLRNSYYNSLVLAKKNGIDSISFPAISTGVYHYPKEEAAEIAIRTVTDFIHMMNYPIKIVFIMFDKDNFEIYNKKIEELKNELS